MFRFRTAPWKAAPATASGLLRLLPTLRRSSSSHTLPSNEPPLVVGVGSPVRDADAAVCVVHELAGGSAVAAGDGVAYRRLPAGEFLGLMDLCAFLTAMRFVTGRTALSGEGSDVGAATVAATEILFRRPVVRDDMVRLEGTVVNAGRTSVCVHVAVAREEFPTRRLQPVADAFFFMVAITPQLRPAAVVPSLRLSTPAHRALHHRSIAVRDRQRALDTAFARMTQPPGDTLSESALGNTAAPLVTLDALLADTNNASKARHVRFEDTVTRASRLFFPGHLNLNKTIFGGEIMRWMEQHATHCARVFLRRKGCFSVAMHEVEFKSPIRHTDWVELTAAVVYVQGTTLDVLVRVTRNVDGRTETHMEASFVLTTFDEVGGRVPIDVGLDLASAAPEWLHAFARARLRRQSIPTRASPAVNTDRCVSDCFPVVL